MSVVGMKFFLKVITSAISKGVAAIFFLVNNFVHRMTQIGGHLQNCIFVN